MTRASGPGERGAGERGAGERGAGERGPGGTEGSGSVLALALVAVIVAVTSITIVLSGALVARLSIQGAADDAALAAADVAVGIAPGIPCATARRVATANHSSMSRCTVDGLVVTVQVRGRFLTFPLGSTATAGPPWGG